MLRSVKRQSFQAKVTLLLILLLFVFAQMGSVILLAANEDGLFAGGDSHDISHVCCSAHAKDHDESNCACRLSKLSGSFQGLIVQLNPCPSPVESPNQSIVKAQLFYPDSIAVHVSQPPNDESLNLEIVSHYQDFFGPSVYRPPMG